MVLLYDPTARPSAGISQLIRKRPIDDHVFDPDVGRRNGSLSQTVLRFDVHGVDDNVTSVFQDPRAGGPNALEDGGLAAGRLAICADHA